MKRAVLIEGILMILIGVIAAGEGVRLTIQKDPYTLYDMLGPGLYVVAFAIAMIVTGVGHLIANCKKSVVSEKITASKEMRTRMIYMMAVLAGYVFFIDVVGYLIASLAFFLLEFKVAGVKSWLTSALLSVVITVSFYLVFVRYCSMVFPKGILFQ